MLCRLLKKFLTIWLWLFLSTCKEKALEPIDQIAPSAIFNLSIIDSTSTSIHLSWQAPGDDGMSGQATTYQLRYLFTYITDSNWTAATIYPIANVPGTPLFWENTWVYGLNADTGYYFGLRSADEEGNWSPLSNIVTFKVPDTISPQSIIDLKVIKEDTFAILLEWSAPSDDYSTERVTTYEIRYDTQMIADSTWGQAQVSPNQLEPSNPSEKDTIEVTGLKFNTTYYIGIKSKDEVSNESEISNVIEGRTLFKDTSTIIWETLIGGASEEKVYALTLTSDGGVVISGRRKEIGAEADGFIAKIDGLGNLLWEKKFGGSGYEALHDIVEASDGSIVALGTTYSFGFTAGAIYLVKVDQMGDLIWEESINGGFAWAKGHSIGASSDGGFVIGGTVFTCTIAVCVPHAYILKVNAVGTEEWHSTYLTGFICGNDEQYNWAYGKTAFVSESGYGFVWDGVGPSSCGHTGPGQPEYIVAFQKVDVLGQTTWQFSVRDYGPVGNASGLATDANGKGYLLEVIRYVTEVFKISNSGIQEWIFHDERFQGVHLSGLVSLSSDNVMVARQNGSQILLVVLDEAGGTLHETIIDRSNYGPGDLLAQTFDGHVVIAGSFVGTNGNWDIRLLKIRNDF